MKRHLPIFLPLVLALLAAGMLAMWAYPASPAWAKSAYPSAVRSWYTHTGQTLELRLPGRDETANVRQARVNIRGQLQTFAGRPDESVTASWSSFRGDDRTNVRRDGPPLRRQLPDPGPPVAWQLELGEGYAGPAVRHGRVFILDHDATAHRDQLRCFSLADGQEIWRRSYDVFIKRQHGFSRTVPAVSDDVVVSIGPKGHVLACRPDDGEYLWSIDLVSDYGSTIPPWYGGQCPLIDRGQVVLAPAGPKVLMLAVQADSGTVRWSTPNTPGWTMTHSSIRPIAFGGRTIYLYCGSGGIAGIDADSGELLFASDEWKVKIATIPTPVDMGEGRVFLCGGYGAGSRVMTLSETGSGTDVTITPSFGPPLPPEVFGSEQQTPVFHDGHLYGVLPKVGSVSGQMTCLGPDGRTRWRSGPDDTFGLGAYLVGDGMLLAVSDEGVLTAAATTPEGWQKQWQNDILKGHESWGPMALVDGRLLLRDLTTMRCIDLRRPTVRSDHE